MGVCLVSWACGVYCHERVHALEPAVRFSLAFRLETQTIGIGRLPACVRSTTVLVGGGGVCMYMQGMRV